MGIAFSRSFLLPPAMVCLAAVLLASCAWPSVAQQNSNSLDPKRLAVDVVSVRGVGRLHGIVLEQDPETLSIVVRRKWLEDKHPDFFKEHLETERKAFTEGREKLKQRIAQWRTERAGQDGKVIADFLNDNEKMLGLDKPLDASQFEFTIVFVDNDAKRNVYVQSKGRHQLVGIGWSEKVDGLESMTATVLKREIQNQKIDIDTYQIKLGNQMPPLLESDEKWAARKALIEFAMLPRLEYQGVGEMFIRRGADANPMQALQGMLQGGGGFSQIEQLGKELGLPEFKDRRSDSEKNAWLERMIRTAEKEGHRSFSVSKLEQGDTVSVTTTLYFKAFDDEWYPLKEFAASERLRDQNTEDVEQVMQDPQVARVIEMAKQFGVNNQGMLEKAMRSGVATKKALDKTMSELDQFVESYSFEIDNPPIEK